MKKIIFLIVALASLAISCSAFAADVSGYEKHATINLDPFKSDFYEGTFFDIPYTATIFAAKNIEMKMGSGDYARTVILAMRIDMKTLNGIESFTPFLSFHGISSSAVYCVIGENRYLLFAEYGDVTIGKNLYNVLKEISTTSYNVILCDADSTAKTYTLTDDDKSVITQFLWDMDYSGLTSQLVDDENVVIITQYN